MNRYLRMCAIFLLIQGCVLVLLMVIGRPWESYLSAAGDKSELLATAPSPRLVLVGDSNLAFGVDSERLRRGLAGAYHPVNLGLHGGLGLDFELNQALSHIRSGDLVVLSPSYESLWADTTESTALWSTILRYRRAWRYVPESQRPWVLKRFVADDIPLVEAHDIAWMAVDAVRASTLDWVVDRSRKALGWTVSPRLDPYTRQGFNGFGDQTGAWGAESEYDLQNEVPFPAGTSTSHLSRATARVRRFTAAATRKGARVLMAYPAIPDDWYAEHRREVDTIAASLESRLEIAFLNRPTDVVYEPGLFFDTRYHLTAEGVQKRTEDLVSDLQAYLAGEEVP